MKAERKTKEVVIVAQLTGEEQRVETGDVVFDHLLTSLFFYMEKGVEIKATWDLRHHLWEDMGLILGALLSDALKGQKLSRFGHTIIPMDDALVLVSVDLSRAYLSFDLDFVNEEGFELSLVREFFHAFSRSLPATIHVKKLAGFNPHHLCEAAFKALGVSLRDATKPSSRVESTKGEI